jgi:heptosyltransferase-3
MNLKTKYLLHKVILITSLIKDSLSLLLITIFKKNTIHIVQVEHIGDIISSEPILEYLRANNPNAFIIWYTKKNYIDLLKYNPHLNKIINITCITEWIYLKKIFRFKNQYELHLNDRMCLICKRGLYRTNNYNVNITALNYLNHGSLLSVYCQINNLPVLKTSPKLYYAKTNVLKKHDLVAPYVIVHCKSNEEIKDWLDHKWIEVLKYINTTLKIGTIEIGSFSTLEYNNNLHINICGKLSLLECMEIIDNSMLYIGIDSGPAHMANAFNKKGIILLGDYYNGIKNYNPFSGNYGNSNNSNILKADSSVKNINTDVIIKAIKEIL